MKSNLLFQSHYTKNGRGNPADETPEPSAHTRDFNIHVTSSQRCERCKDVETKFRGNRERLESHFQF